MSVTSLQNWISENPALAAGAAALLFVLIYLLARLIFGRGLTHVASLTKNKYDDVIIKKLRPYRASLLAAIRNGRKTTATAVQSKITGVVNLVPAEAY